MIINYCCYCNTGINYGSLHHEKGLLWKCELCYKYFCSQCFIDNAGNENWIKNFECDTFVCPDCFNKDFSEKAIEDYHYEICDNDGDIIEDGYASLDDAVEWALENNGYTINRVWLPVDESGSIDYSAEVIAAEIVWEREVE